MKTRLKGATVVGPFGLLDRHDVVIEDGRISAVVPTGAVDSAETIVDCEGAFVAPGMIDVHSDYIEHMAAPRPTSLFDFSLSLRVLERELIAHGITTMFHSLSFYGNTDFGSNPVRSPENSRKLIDSIQSIHERDHLIRHRFHARFEIDTVDRVDELKSLLRDGKVHLLSFMDHSPGQGQYRDLEVYKLILKGYRQLDDREAERVVAESRGRKKLSLESLAEIADVAKSCRVAVASHDDDTIGKLQSSLVYRSTISEFPITMEVALEARSLGLGTVAGAPNVLMGGSHSGNLNAAEAIAVGAIDVLCSDYYPPSMLHAVFLLNAKKAIPLHEAMNLVTLNPAKAVGIDSEYGSIEAGKRADLIVVRRLEDGFPYVSDALVDGKLVLSYGYRRHA